MRPVGVTLIGGFELFISSLLLVLAITAFLGFGVLSAILGSTARIGGPAMPFLASAGIVTGCIVLVPGALFGLLGWNLLRMREWARMATFVLAVLGAVGAALGLISAIAHLRPFFIMATTIRLIMNLAIIWYLNQPQIRQLFNRSRPVLNR